MAEVQAKLVTNQHAVGKKPRALKRKAVNALCCYLFLRLRRLHLTGVMRCTLCSALQCIAVQREEQPASYLERFFRGCCSYLPSPIDTAGKAILLRVVVRL